MIPVLLMERPVSAGVPVPEANSKFSFPEGEALLFPTGSACQRKFCGTETCVELLNAEASKSNGWESNASVEVAVPVNGNDNWPRIVAPPFTSNLAAGAVVPTPMLLLLGA